MKRLLATTLLLFNGLSAHATVITHTAEIGPLPGFVDEPLLPAIRIFDVALGNLTSVTAELTGTLSASITLTSSAPVDVETCCAWLGALISVSGPGIDLSIRPEIEFITEETTLEAGSTLTLGPRTVTVMDTAVLRGADIIPFIGDGLTPVAPGFSGTALSGGIVGSRFPPAAPEAIWSVSETASLRVSYAYTPVSSPGTLLLLIAGAAGAAGAHHRRHKRGNKRPGSAQRPAPPPPGRAKAVLF